jgi:hypothetical protein
MRMMRMMRMKINNQKCILLVTVGIFAISLGIILSEGTNQNCCGSLIAGQHFLESDTKPPKIIKRCFASSEDWNGMPCTNADSDKCCGGQGGCIPTDKGGYCKTSSGNKVFRGGKLRDTLRLGTSIDLDDPSSYSGDADLELTGEDLYERRRVERDEAIKLKREKAYGNLGYTSEEALISDTQTVLFWIYLIHLVFILALSFSLKDSLSLIMQGFVNTTVLKYRQFQGY